MNALVENTITFYITDSQEQPPVFYGSALPTEESENKKNEILTSGNWVELGSVYYEGYAEVGLTVEYNQTFQIPDSVPRGNVNARVWFTGAHWDATERKYNLIVSENIKTESYPSLTNLNVSQPDYCVSGPAAVFSWTFSDPVGTQSAYQVQVDNNSNFSSPEDDSGKVFSDSNSYATPLGKLQYNKTYYWRAKVWDSVNIESDWENGPSFTTPKHTYPFIDFSWAPLNPDINENTLFTDQSTVYGGAAKASWLWTFQNASPDSSSQQNPTVKFSSVGLKPVTLTVTDSDGLSCLGSKTADVKFPLPEWRETAPSQQ